MAQVIMDHGVSGCFGIWHQVGTKRWSAAAIFSTLTGSRGMSYQEAPGAGLRDNGGPETRRGEKVHY